MIRLFKLNLIAISVAISLSPTSYASLVREDIDYQLFRDFAENKGKFNVGSTNIQIQDKSGNVVGTMMQDVPMLDLSAMTKDGYSTLINPQYILSVAHNRTYKTVQFGAQGDNPDAHHYTYQIVDRNDYPDNKDGLIWDYHVPRLNKLVTEVVPAIVSDAGINTSSYLDSKRFPLFVRAGAGLQATRDKNGNTQHLASAYRYLTGGTALPLFPKSTNHWLEFTGSLQGSNYGPMATYGTPGDSGSGYYAYDKNQNKWVLVSILKSYRGMDGNFNRSIIVRDAYNKEKFQEDVGVSIDNKTHNATFYWEANGSTSALSQHNKTQKFNLNLLDQSIIDNTSYPTGSAGVKEVVLPQEENGKSLYFSGYKATIILKDNINQGAGVLNINAGVTIRPENDETWQGAGIIVGKNKLVDWRVKNPKGDRLSKLGEGYLYVNGRGENLGDISVGDGTVILNQQADSQGKKQAFNSVGIVSGRPTVILNSADQVKPDNIYFGFRGGRLDVNGNNLTFNRIQNLDDGAKIVNNSDQESTLTIKGPKPIDSNDLIWGNWGKAGADIYEYTNTHNGRRKDYFSLVPGGNAKSYFPTEANSNGSWEYLSNNKQDAINQILDRKNEEQRYQTFNGYLGESNPNAKNGRLNIIYDPQYTSNTMPSEDSLTWGSWAKAGADIYEYINKHQGNRKDYFVLKGNAQRYYPTNQTSSEHWEYLSSDRNEAIRKVLERKHNQLIEEGKQRRLYAFTGGFNLNGDLTIKGGNVLLSGKPTPHAYDVLNGQDVVFEDDWQNKQFNARNIITEGYAKLHVGRNVTNVNSSFTAKNNSELNLGFTQNKTPNCYYSEFTGKTHCNIQASISQEVFNSLPTTSIVGNISLQDNANLNLGKAYLTGNIQADRNTSISINNQGSWINTGNSTVGNISLLNNAQITLNDKFNTNTIPSRFNKLIINGNLNGEGKFNYVTNLANNQNDFIEVNGIAKGIFTLALQNTGREPEISRSNNLLALKNPKQSNQSLTVRLDKGHIDLGAYRYVLANNNFNYYLYNPLKELKNSEPYNQKVALEKAISETEKKLEMLGSLETSVVSAREADRTARQNLTTISNNVNKLNNRLSTLERYLQYYRGYRTQYNKLRTEIDNVRQKLSQATSDLKNAKNNAANTSTHLAKIESDLQNAQNSTNRIEANLDALKQDMALAKQESKVLLNHMCEINNADCGFIDISANNEDNISTVQKYWMSQYANAAVSALSAEVNSILQLGNNLDRQTNINHRTFSVWSSTESLDTEHHSDLYRNYKHKSNLVQLGLNIPLKNNISIGAILSRNNSSNKFSDDITGKAKLISSSIYANWKLPYSTVMHLDGSLTRGKTNIKSNEESKYHRYISSIGLNISKTWQVVGLNIQPNVGGRYHYFSSNKYNLDGAEINNPGFTFSSYYAGLNLNKEFDIAEVKVLPNLSVHYVDANQKKVAINVNSHTFDQRFGRYVKAETGVNVSYKNWGLALNIGFLKGNQIKKQDFASMKISYNW